MFKRLDNASGKRVTVFINGEKVSVPDSDTVAAAVLGHGLRYTRTTPISASPRAPYCMMGVCFECLMVIDGVPNQRACQRQVLEGMVIESQQGVGAAI